MTVRYIIAVSNRGILPEGEPLAMRRLRARLLIQQVDGYWGLTDGIDEKVYRVNIGDASKLKPEEIREFEDSFAQEKRILRIYELEELTSAGK